MRKIDELGYPSGLSPEQMNTLKRVFAGMEIIEAEANLMINAKDEDAIGAMPNDLENCVFARACHRLYDSTIMVFMATVAYVDLVCEDGVRRVHRFQLSQRFMDAIRIYDESKGKVFIPGMYLLRAPALGRQLEVSRKRSREYSKSPKYAQWKAKKARIEKMRRAAIKAGAYLVKTKNRAYRKGIVGVVRSGTGLVQTRQITS